MTARRLAKRVVLATAGLTAGFGVLLAVEVQVARMGPDLATPDFDLDVDAPPDIPGAPVRWLRLVWLGDSTAAGVGASDEGSTMPRVVGARLGVPFGSRVLATSGARVADVLEEQAPAVGALVPDVVLISVGANDTTHLTRRGVFRSRYARLVRALPADARVVLLGVPDMGAPTRLPQPLRALVGWQGRRLDEEVRRVAENSGATYVDIAGATGPTFRRHPDQYFAVDDFHPSDAGYLLWAEAVLGELHRQQIL